MHLESFENDDEATCYTCGDTYHEHNDLDASESSVRLRKKPKDWLNE